MINLQKCYSPYPSYSQRSKRVVFGEALSAASVELYDPHQCGIAEMDTQRKWKIKIYVYIR